MPRDSIVLLGVNHKTTPVEIREKIALSDGYEEPLGVLKKIHDCRESYLLSTCNRVEIYVASESLGEADEHLAVAEAWWRAAGQGAGREKETLMLHA